EAREALGVETAPVDSRPVEEHLLAYASLTAPWQQHAFATSRLPGQIVALQVQPGQTVGAGQPLAEVRSVELESLQQDLLNLQNEIQLSAQLLKAMEQGSGVIPEVNLLEAHKRHQQNINA